MYWPYSLNSFKKLRAVAAKREQQSHPEHFGFLTDGTGREIDSTDPEQLLLPALWPGVFFGYGFRASENLTA
jgi:hypothetical protein